MILEIEFWRFLDNDPDYWVEMDGLAGNVERAIFNAQVTFCEAWLRENEREEEKMNRDGDMVQLAQAGRVETRLNLRAVRYADSKQMWLGHLTVD